MKPKTMLPFVWTGSLLAAYILYKGVAFVHLMPVAATREAHWVDHTFNTILLLTIVIFCVVLGTLLYSVVAFRATSESEQGAPFHHSASWRVEIAWVVATTGLTLWLAYFGWTELRMLAGKPEADIDVQVTASQFSWEFFYPKFNQQVSRLVLPTGKRVRLSLSSQDVVHSFWVPEFRTKQDALPGKITTLYLTPERLGVYTLLCNQLCGLDHTVMQAYVDVVDEEEFEKRFTKGQEVW